MFEEYSYLLDITMYICMYIMYTYCFFSYKIDRGSVVTNRPNRFNYCSALVNCSQRVRFFTTKIQKYIFDRGRFWNFEL